MRGFSSSRKITMGRPTERGSMLITSLLFSAALGVAMVGYLSHSKNTLKYAERNLYTTDASNLAESGIEEALYCFKQVSSGTSTATAWSGWTVSGANAMRTLDPVNRNEQAIGTVKVFVKGYNGSDSDPYVIAHATIAPLDGSKPIVKILRVNLGLNSYFANGLVGIEGIKVTRTGSTRSFDSNPSDSPTGPWLKYKNSLDRAKSSMVTVKGSITVPSNYRLSGDLYLGTNVSTTASLITTGTTYQNYSGIFPLPDYPTESSVSNSENLTFNSSSDYWRCRRWWWLRLSRRYSTRYLPATLPENGDVPASDGRYYYFCDNTTIANLTIAANKNVTIVGTNTNMTGGLYLNSKSTLQVYIDGPVTIGGYSSSNAWRNGFTPGDWAGALKVFTSTTSDCLINCDFPVYMCLYAPNSKVIFTGGWGTGSWNGQWSDWFQFWLKRYFNISATSEVVGSFVGNRVEANDNIDFIYDEALRTSGSGRMWSLKGWSELNAVTERATIASLTGNYLP